jgi:Mg-chelatase subunit ChlD
MANTVISPRGLPAADRMFDYMHVPIYTVPTSNLSRQQVFNMEEKNRGIEIVRQQGNTGFSITVGGEKISSEGNALNLHLEKQLAYVYLVIDCSGSMAGYKLDQARQGATDFAADALRNGYAVGLIGFDTTAVHISEPVNNLVSLIPAIRALKMGGSTNMTAAIKLGHERLKILTGTRVIVIATDGMPDNALEAMKTARAAKDEGIDFIAIGTDDANLRFLERLATKKELGSRVSREMFAKAIASASTLLPPPRKSSQK